MAITKDQKTQILQDLVDKFGRSKTVVFSDYRGLDVASISTLRNQLREKGAETKVAKKTLIKLAAKESNIGDLGDDVMEGPVSVTFSYEDELSGLKVLFKFSKENENLKLLGGIIDGKVVSAEEIITLAKLPSHEELIAKFIGSMNAPVSGFVGTLSNLLSGMVRVLNAYKDTLPAEEAAAEPAKKEAPKPEPGEAESEEVKAEEPKSEASATADEPEAEAETEAEETADKPEKPVPTEAEGSTTEGSGEEESSDKPETEEGGDAAEESEEKKAA